MAKCSLCSIEIKNKYVLCKDCEKKIKQSHPDSKKGLGINKRSIFFGLCIVAVLFVIALVIQSVAGNHSNLFQLFGVVLIGIMVVYQIIAKV